MMTLTEAPGARNAQPVTVALAELRAVRASMALASARLSDLTPRGRRRARAEAR
jgi:hypothetical protein